MNQVFELEGLVQTVAQPYREFLRVPAMSAGLYVLPPGATDRQTPHREDEIYYVALGRGKVQIGAGEQSVSQGSIVFVEAGCEHRFFDITEQLVLVVVFAPAETTP